MRNSGFGLVLLGYVVVTMAEGGSDHFHQRINQELKPLVASAFRELESKLEPSHGRTSTLVKGIEDHVNSEIKELETILQQYEGTALKIAELMKKAEENVKHYNPFMKIALNVVIGEQTKELFPVFKDLFEKEHENRARLEKIVGLLGTEKFGLSDVNIAEIFSSVTALAQNIINDVLATANQITNQEVQTLTALLLPFREVLGDMFVELMNGINQIVLN